MAPERAVTRSSAEMQCGLRYRRRWQALATSLSGRDSRTLMADSAGRQLVVGIPGPWENRTRFVQEIVRASDGAFLFAGRVLFDHRANDHVDLSFEDADSSVTKAFRIAGRGRLSDDTLQQIAAHRSIAYLHFALDIRMERSRILKFTRAVLGAGGVAVKLESSGAAHEATRWIGLLESDDLFDLYYASVVLVGDDSQYYSCGMHQFSLPECQLSKAVEIETAADLINRFNFYQIAEHPVLISGHTFGLGPDAPRYRLDLVPDRRHDASSLFHNSNGVWDLLTV